MTAFDSTSTDSLNRTTLNKASLLQGQDMALVKGRVLLSSDTQNGALRLSVGSSVFFVGKER